MPKARLRESGANRPASIFVCMTTLFAEVTHGNPGPRRAMTPDASKLPGPQLSLFIDAYRRAGFAPIPICDPEHAYMWPAHISRCKSPGKAPLTPRWQQFSSTPPSPAISHQMFRRHRGNVGIVVPKGIAVLDVDPRADGLTSLEILQHQYGWLPDDTPMQHTGGGGLHIWFRLPEGMDDPGSASGSLAPLGYSGVEFKAARQQVVVEPSRHASGGSYQWEEGRSITECEIQPVPNWLLGLIQRAIGQHPQSAPGRTGEGTEERARATGHGKWSYTEGIALFDQVYPEGGRRVGTGLPRLVGLLRGHGVGEEEAARFLLQWQEDHVRPCLEDSEITGLVVSMYARYGHPPADRYGGGARYVRDIGAYLARGEGTGAHVVGNSPICSQLRVPDDDVPVTDDPPSDVDGGDPVSEGGGNTEAPPGCRGCGLSREEWTSGVGGYCSEECRQAQIDHERDMKLWLAATYPVPEGELADVLDVLYSHVKNGRRLIAHHVISNSWKNGANVAWRRRALHRHFDKLFQAHLASGGSFWRGGMRLEAESEDAARKWISSIREKAKRRGGLCRWFVTDQCTEGYSSYVIVLYCTVEVPGLTLLANTPGVPGYPDGVQADMIRTLQCLNLPGSAYHWRNAYGGSQEWDMPRKRTGQWQSVGYRDGNLVMEQGQGPLDEAAAIAEGIATHIAPEEEILLRAPEKIIATRHYLLPASMPAEQGLLWAHDVLGYSLTRRARAELEALGLLRPRGERR